MRPWLMLMVVLMNGMSGEKWVSCGEDVFMGLMGTGRGDIYWGFISLRNAVLGICWLLVKIKSCA